MRSAEIQDYTFQNRALHAGLVELVQNFHHDNTESGHGDSVSRRQCTSHDWHLDEGIHGIAWLSMLLRQCSGLFTIVANRNEMDRDVLSIPEPRMIRSGLTEAGGRHDSGQETSLDQRTRAMARVERQRVNRMPAEFCLNNAHVLSTTTRWTMLWSNAEIE